MKYLVLFLILTACIPNQADLEDIVEDAIKITPEKPHP